MDNLTIVIITKNEASYINSIVKTWQHLAPVLVVDSNSWDQTAEIAVAAGAKVIQQSWLGFGRQKQFAIEQAETDWVLSIDADEWPSETLILSLKNLRLEDPSVAFEIKRQSYFLGLRVKFCGWGNDYVLRLFNKRYGRFDSRVVHEKVIHGGIIKRVSGCLIHQSYKDRRDILRKTARYGRLTAQHVLSRKRHINAPTVRRFLAPWWAIFRTLVLKAGFLDGLTGIRIAKMNGMTVERKYQLVSRAIKRQQSS